MPARMTTSRTLATKPAWWNWRALTFTEMQSGRVRSSDCHTASWAQAVRKTHSPSGMMWPVSSASGMNSAGETIPASSSGQRTSASAPTTRP